MNFLTLNIRGVTGVEKPFWVRKLKREARLSFIAIQETHLAHSQENYWNRFWDNSPLMAVSVDATGRSGGLASIWDPGVFVVDSVVKGQFFLLTSGSMQGVEERVNILNIYAPNDYTRRRALWDSIVEIRHHMAGLWMALGDFNDVRYAEERVNSVFDINSASAFNDFISRSGWLEYRMAGGQFTYISGHEDIKLSKLDRVLVCDEFMRRWPTAKLEVLKKGLSDHCPVVLSCNSWDYGPIPFKFFNSWADSTEVKRFVQTAVGNPVSNMKADKFLCLILKRVKTAIKKWREEVKLSEAKTTAAITQAVENIEKMAEVARLNDTEKKLRVELRLKLRKIELAKAKDLHQKARINWIKYGDDNTSYFHARINVNKARNRINGLNIRGEWVTEPKVVKEEIRLWFKKQFAEPIRRRPKFLNLGLPKLKDTHLEALIQPFSLDEIWKAVKSCDGGKAPGPDGFTMKFYKKHWASLSSAVKAVMDDFFESGVISFGCNASFIALVPKSSDPQVCTDFRPISLVGSLYKIISKTLMLRLKDVMDPLISPTQSAFVGERFILDSPLIVSETISWAKKNKRKILIFKVDFQRAYDSLNWKFLFQSMEYMGFPAKWVSWIKGCLNSGRGSVLVNGSPTDEFPFKRGLRQGDPLSPFLFILAMEVVNMLMNRAVEVGLFRGIKLPNNGPIISHLCYADDVLFIGEWSEQNVTSLNRFLTCLHLISGLQVNYHKCHLFGVGVDEAEIIRMAGILKCKVGSFPFIYLGIPIGANMKRVKFWQPVIEKFNRKLSSWKAKNLSMAGRVTLAKAVLGSLPSYYLSLFPAPKAIIKKLEGLRRDFIWGYTGRRNKVRWIQWKKMIKPMNSGGIGIGSIKDFNIAMLSKWWWRFKNNPTQLWAEVVKAIHESDSNKKMIPVKNNVPGIWKDIGEVDKTLEKLGVHMRDKLSVTIGNGELVSFWKDIWAVDVPLKDRFPRLYRLAAYKSCSVASCLSSYGAEAIWAWDWAKCPDTEDDWIQLDELMSALDPIKLSKQKDEWKWGKDSEFDFSVKDIRLEIGNRDDSAAGNMLICWNSWAPPKCNLLTWRAMMGKVAAKTELVARGIPVPGLLCDRCGIGEEDPDHVFVKCLMAQDVWWQIFVWIRIPFPLTADKLIDVFKAIQQSTGSKKWKRLVLLVATATVWSLWHARNIKTFESKFLHPRSIVESIKEDTYLWVCQRSRLKAPPWEKWIDFNVSECV
ncbi:putative RNA-directed DNA polymerase [Helianthus annuus]|nr:putative RNA-directed DNA polymerase [Helianthus annuus]